MEKCLICKNITLSEYKSYSICECCQDKYGDWIKIKEKLLSSDISESLKADIIHNDGGVIKETKPFECDLSYSGGTKNDIIRVICNLMYQEGISLTDIEEGQF